MVLYLLIIAGTMLYKYCGVLPSLRVERDAWDARWQQGIGLLLVASCFRGLQIIFYRGVDEQQTLGPHQKRSLHPAEALERSRSDAREPTIRRKRGRQSPSFIEQVRLH